jgi:predicted nucleotidyltransferase
VVNDTGVRKLIDEIVQKIVKEYRPEKIILFGSYAYGEPHSDSDIDLLIIKKTEERPIDRRVAVRRILSDPNLRTPIESLVLTPEEIKKRQTIGDQFIEEILRRGMVLYAV